MGESFQGVGRRSRLRARDDRRNHRPGAPARRRRKRGTQKEAIGRSRGGLSTKIHIAVDTLGHPLRLILTAGQVHESTQASALIEGLTLVSLIVDKGYDNDGFRVQLAEAETDAVIPPLGSRTAAIAYDENAYGRASLHATRRRPAASSRCSASQPL